MAVNASELRRGMAVDQDGEISVVLDVQHRTPGNLRAFVQVSLRSVRTGKSSDLRFSSQQKIEVVPMMTTKMEFSYKDGQDFVFTDPENYETVTLNPELVGDAKNYLVENAGVVITFIEAPRLPAPPRPPRRALRRRMRRLSTCRRSSTPSGPATWRPQ